MSLFAILILLTLAAYNYRTLVLVRDLRNVEFAQGFSPQKLQEVSEVGSRKRAVEILGEPLLIEQFIDEERPYRNRRLEYYTRNTCKSEGVTAWLSYDLEGDRLRGFSVQYRYFPLNASGQVQHPLYWHLGKRIGWLASHQALVLANRLGDGDNAGIDISPP